MRFRPHVLALLFLAMFGIAPVAPAQAAIVTINVLAPPPVAVAPPPLPVYVVPPPPAVGYVWIPGHWLWNGVSYFWVPGTWVAPPGVGLLWTPGYWGWVNNAYIWHAGYWGHHVGFYGGVVYGGGYDGVGFSGGHWEKNGYIVNKAVINVPTNAGMKHAPNVSFNGGDRGIKATPTSEQRGFVKEQHVVPTAEQEGHIRSANAYADLTESRNHGKPAVAATAHPGMFKGPGVVPATEGGRRGEEQDRR